jgi:phytanoyl-CoA hydroxylase
MPSEIRRHPWNQSFEWAPVTGPFRRISQEQARSYNERGYFVFEDAFDPVAVARIREEVDPFDAQSTAYLRQHGGSIAISDADSLTYSMHLVKQSALLKALCSTGVLPEIARDLLGPEVNLYWDQAVYKKPDKPRPFPWHQDSAYNFVEPQHFVTCWIALTDATVENGCPFVVPGLHKVGTLHHWWTEYGLQCLEEPAESVPAEARAGSVVVFSSLTPHKTGPNETRSVRKAYLAHYAPAGAEVLREVNGVIVREPANDPERQFPVVRGGELLEVR